MGLTLTCLGGAGVVTGSNFLVEGDKGKILIDCGIEQGKEYIAARAYEPFPFDPSTIDALVLTHAHLDHVGRCPKLVKDGFTGKAFMTPPTRDLVELILRDSAHLLGEEAKRTGREPLYTEGDVDAFLGLVQTVEYHKEIEAAPGLSIFLRNTGHVLGSASVRIKDEHGRSIALTGDIGNSPSPLLPDWEPIPDADAVLMESVYGDRLHPEKAERVEVLRSTLARAIKRGGTILIPAFSLERTQLMLYEISNFFDEGSLPKVPVYLDSPLAIKVTAVYEKWGPQYFKETTKDEMRREGSVFEFPFLEQTLGREDSEKIATVSGPKIIIAGAGMSHGGRISRWEARYLPDPTTTMLMVGYQAPGSPGRLLEEGARTVRIAGAPVTVRAHVESIHGWSGHADRDELMQFAEAALPSAKTIFVALGEPSSERFLAQRIHDFLGAHAVVPEAGERWEIMDSGARKR